MFEINRRRALMLLSGSLGLPGAAMAEAPKNVQWDDLIPPGIPYSEIIGEGEIDFVNDTWNPIYDANATKLNEALNGVLVRMPGYVIPLEQSAKGVTEFMLVPYVGACIHTPPPPANQLVLVNSDTPWEFNDLWDPVWVTGRMKTKVQDTDLGTTGYTLVAETMEPYEW
jgi:hypothetical protein